MCEYICARTYALIHLRGYIYARVHYIFSEFEFAGFSLNFSLTFFYTYVRIQAFTFYFMLYTYKGAFSFVRIGTCICTYEVRTYTFVKIKLVCKQALQYHVYESQISVC